MKEKGEVNSWNNYMYSPLPHIHTSGGGGGGEGAYSTYLAPIIHGCEIIQWDH